MRTQEFEKLTRFQDVSGRGIDCMAVDISALEKNTYSRRDECAAMAYSRFTCISNDLIQTGAAAAGNAAATEPAFGPGTHLVHSRSSHDLTEDDRASQPSAIRVAVPTPIGGNPGARQALFGIEKFSCGSHFCYHHTDGTKKLIPSRGLSAARMSATRGQSRHAFWARSTEAGNRNLNQRIH